MKSFKQTFYIRTCALGTVLAFACVGAQAQTNSSSDTSTRSSSGIRSSTTANDSTTPSSTDKKAAMFLKEANSDNQKEIQFAQMGTNRAQNAEVKMYAEHLFRDHSEARTKLTSLVQEHGVTDTTKEKKAEKEMAKLEKLSGAEFDKEFVTAALKDHQKDIAKYQKAIENVQASDVKEFAQQTLPKLQEHLQAAARVARTIGIPEATISAYTRDMQGTAVGGSTTTGESSDTFNSTKEAGEKNQKGDGAHRLTPEGQAQSPK